MDASLTGPGIQHHLTTPPLIFHLPPIWSALIPGPFSLRVGGAVRFSPSLVAVLLSTLLEFQKKKKVKLTTIQPKNRGKKKEGRKNPCELSVSRCGGVRYGCSAPTTCSPVISFSLVILFCCSSPTSSLLLFLSLSLKNITQSETNFLLFFPFFFLLCTSPDGRHKDN